MKKSLRMDVYITDECNLKCKYCNIPQEKLISNVPVLDKYLDENKHLYSSIDILISGGEPTMLHDEMVELIEKHSDVTFRILTNGTNFDKVLSMTKPNVRWILSWDGPETDRNYYPIKTLKRMIEHNIFPKISYTVNNSNYHRVTEDLEILYKESNGYYDKEIIKNKKVLTLNISRNDNSYYDVDLKQFEESMVKLIHYFDGDMFMFRDAVKCEREVCNDSSYVIIGHTGKVSKNGCSDIRVHSFDYKKCENCNITVCPSKQCKIRIMALNGNTDVYCKMNAIIQKVSNEYKASKEYMNSYFLKCSGIELIITSECNMACTYCFEGKDITSKRNLLTRETVDKLYNLLNKNGIINEGKNFKITLFGGEPLKKENAGIIKYLIDKFKSHKNVYYFTSTNGLDLCSEEILNLLSYIKEEKIKFNIQVSLGVDREEHNSCRLTKARFDSYDLILNNIKLIRAKYEDYFNLNINCVVTNVKKEYNINDFKKIFEVSKTISVFNNQSLNESLTNVTKNNIKNIIKAVFDLYKEGKITFHKLKHTLKLTNYNGKGSRSEQYGCGACVDIVAVMGDGTVIPCHYTLSEKLLDKYAIGNIHTNIHGFKENLTSCNLSCKQDFNYEGIKCSECRFESVCAKCKVGYEVENGSLDKVSKFTHEYTIFFYSEVEKILDLRYFKPLSEEEIVQMTEDLETVKSLMDSPLTDETLKEELLEIIKGIELEWQLRKS